MERKGIGRCVQCVLATCGEGGLSRSEQPRSAPRHVRLFSAPRAIHKRRNIGLKSGRPSSRCTYKVGIRPPLQKVWVRTLRPPGNYAHVSTGQGAVAVLFRREGKRMSTSRISTCGKLDEHLTHTLRRSGNGVGRINEVTLPRARLVLGWVTVFGRAYHLGI